jgi:hypothetical protein
VTQQREAIALVAEAFTVYPPQPASQPAAQQPLGLDKVVPMPTQLVAKQAGRQAPLTLMQLSGALPAHRFLRLFFSWVTVLVGRSSERMRGQSYANLRGPVRRAGCKTPAQGRAGRARSRSRQAPPMRRSTPSVSKARC